MDMGVRLLAKSISKPSRPMWVLIPSILRKHIAKNQAIDSFWARVQTDTASSGTGFVRFIR